jgi:hypothetical protein
VGGAPASGMMSGMMSEQSPTPSTHTHQTSHSSAACLPARSGSRPRASPTSSSSASGPAGTVACGGTASSWGAASQPPNPRRAPRRWSWAPRRRRLARPTPTRWPSCCAWCWAALEVRCRCPCLPCMPASAVQRLPAKCAERTWLPWRACPSFATGFWYFLLPVYMWLKNLVWPRTGPLADKF